MPLGDLLKNDSSHPFICLSLSILAQKLNYTFTVLSEEMDTLMMGNAAEEPWQSYWHLSLGRGFVQPKRPCVCKPSQPYAIGDLKSCRLASCLTFKMHKRQLSSFSAGISHLKCGEGTKKWLITMWNGSRKGLRRAPSCSGLLFPLSDLQCSSRSVWQ